MVGKEKRREALQTPSNRRVLAFLERVGCKPVYQRRFTHTRISHHWDLEFVFCLFAWGLRLVSHRQRERTSALPLPCAAFVAEANPNFLLLNKGLTCPKNFLVNGLILVRCKSVLCVMRGGADRGLWISSSTCALLAVMEFLSYLILCFFISMFYKS